MIAGGIPFYIISLAGILFCLSLGRVIEGIPVLKNLIALCGKNSFSIMALHFLIIKFIDFVYSKFAGVSDPALISKWVCSYPDRLFCFYLFFSCFIPVVIGVSAEKILLKRK